MTQDISEQPIQESTENNNQESNMQQALATQVEEVRIEEIMQSPKITFDDFIKVEMKVGKVLAAEILEKSEKLVRLTVDFGEKEPRQVVSGIRQAFPDPVVLIGNTYVFVTNLEPRSIIGLESQAMILAAKDNQGLVLFSPTGLIVPGTKLS